jgi:uncharacterized protein
LKGKAFEETWQGTLEMADQIVTSDFPTPASFEWDERKNLLNLAKHGIDFDDAIEVFHGRIILRQSDRNNEERWIAIGEIEGRIIAVVFTRRGDTLRIISARRARKNEEREYRNKEMGRSSKGQD